jgi:hypothetical protein
MRCPCCGHCGRSPSSSHPSRWQRQCSHLQVERCESVRTCRHVQHSSRMKEQDKSEC